VSSSSSAWTETWQVASWRQSRRSAGSSPERSSKRGLPAQRKRSPARDEPQGGSPQPFRENDAVSTNWTWIFQAKPGEWDLRSPLAEQPRAQWKVATFAAKMKIGDTVYLWESGPNAALLARCRLTSKPVVQPLRPELRDYVRHPKYLGEIRRAGHVVEFVIEPELTRQELLEHAAFAALAPIGGPTAARQGTNFSVPPQAAELLDALVGSRRRH
jgi:hypothetical protein